MKKTTQKQIATKWAEAMLAERDYTIKCETVKVWDTKRAEEINCSKLRRGAMTMMAEYAKDHGMKEYELRQKLWVKMHRILDPQL